MTENLTEMALINQILEDFSEVPRVSIHVPKIKKPTSNGKYLVSKGMKSSYLGAFTKAEVKFIKNIIKIKNRKLFPNPRVLKIMHTVNPNGLVNKSDIHLFSGSSLIGTFRIDVNPKSNATHIISVQKILDILIKNNFKFDLVIFDPPYNAKYDKDYGTNKINKIQNGEKSNFLKWLVEKCLKIVNNNGILISKNWRSIMPRNCKYIGGMISKYGGYRRITLLEVWQYIPNKILEVPFSFPIKKEQEQIKWILGNKGEWTKREREIVNKYTNGKTFTNGVFISDTPKNQFPKLNLKVLTLEKFVESQEIFDLVILNECRKTGGAVKLTNSLKTKLSEDLKGVCILKTYFDPVLEQKGLKKEDQVVLTYNNYFKIDLISIYKGGN